MGLAAASGSGRAGLAIAPAHRVDQDRGRLSAHRGRLSFQCCRRCTRTTLTGLAYNDVLVQGGFIPVGALQGNNLLVQADQGLMRGQGILVLNFDFEDGMSSFVQGDVYGGAHLFGAGGRADIRYQW